MKSSQIYIEKASGEIEVFDVNKLEKSLKNSGASNSDIAEVIQQVSDWVYNGISTHQIYARAFGLLNKKKTKAALRYKLKQAILQFGTTGYPFEHFIGKVFERLGYNVEVSKFLPGKCVEHEVDVVAINQTEKLVIECKYSPNRKKKISIQTPLYIKARVDDLMTYEKQNNAENTVNFSGMLVTNSRFSTESLAYGKCAGLKMLSWNYPENNGLKEFIEKAGVYPVTLLSQINTHEKKLLVEQNVVTCRQLLNSIVILDKLGFDHKKKEQIVTELQLICEG